MVFCALVNDSVALMIAIFDKHTDLHALSLRLTPSPSSTPQSAQLIDCIVNADAVCRVSEYHPAADAEGVIAAAARRVVGERGKVLAGPVGADGGFTVLKQHNDIFAFTPCCSLDC
jgi:hypothetical protein